jgi:hypothetical protein
MVLRTLVDCKYLSAAQLHAYVLPGKSITPVRRSLQRLEAEGWVIGWEAWVSAGGHPKYYLPRRKALTWALRQHQADAADTPLAQMVARLIPTTRRRPVQFAERTVPLFFHHQCATNDIVLALKYANRGAVVWASAWDRPLPKKIGTFAPPQPDAILVLQHGDRRSLLFIETDRASEHAPTFQRGKSRYARLKLRPALLAEMFGIVEFHVLVVVRCPNEGATRRRIAELERAARRGAFAEIVTIHSYEDVLARPAEILDRYLPASAGPHSARAAAPSLDDRAVAA